MARRKELVVGLCETCLHFEDSICFLSEDLNNADDCKSFADTELFQLMGKHIAALRINILNKKQGGYCLICNGAITEKEAVLDHHHKKRIKGSGLIRGVLCRTCNVFIAKSENNAVRYRISSADLPAVLRRTADYLEKEYYPYIHPSEKVKTPKLKKTSYNKLKKITDKDGVAIPAYPVSGKLIKRLKTLFDWYKIEPEFYK